jgi:hypothetical protein
VLASLDVSRIRTYLLELFASCPNSLRVLEETIFDRSPNARCCVVEDHVVGRRREREILFALRRFRGFKQFAHLRGKNVFAPLGRAPSFQHHRAIERSGSERMRVGGRGYLRSNSIKAGNHGLTFHFQYTSLVCLSCNSGKTEPRRLTEPESNRQSRTVPVSNSPKVTRPFGR